MNLKLLKMSGLVSLGIVLSLDVNAQIRPAVKESDDKSKAITFMDGTKRTYDNAEEYLADKTAVGIAVKQVIVNPEREKDTSKKFLISKDATIFLPPVPPSEQMLQELHEKGSSLQREVDEGKKTAEDAQAEFAKFAEPYQAKLSEAKWESLGTISFPPIPVEKRMGEEEALDGQATKKPVQQYGLFVMRNSLSNDLYLFNEQAQLVVLQTKYIKKDKLDALLASLAKNKEDPSNNSSVGFNLNGDIVDRTKPADDASAVIVKGDDYDSLTTLRFGEQPIGFDIDFGLAAPSFNRIEKVTISPEELVKLLQDKGSTVTDLVATVVGADGYTYQINVPNSAKTVVEDTAKLRN